MSADKKPYDWRTHEWKVGDRVLVRPVKGDSFEGMICAANPGDRLGVKRKDPPDEFIHWPHRAEIEPIEEKKPRGFWMRESDTSAIYAGITLREDPPEDLTGWIYVEEKEFRE